MDNSEILRTLRNYLSNFKISEVNDENLKHSNSYFTDPDHKRYLFYPIVFESQEEIIKGWELIENEDIAFYLQGIKYPKNDLRWDMYYLLLYKGEDEIKDDIYVKIERNRFCSRKIIISARNNEQFISDLSKKLPFTTAEFYPDSDLCLVSNHDFFEEFRKMAALDVGVFTDDLIENLEKYREKWLFLLSRM